MEVKEQRRTTLCTSGEIRTMSGIYVDVLNPTPDMIDIKDIAHSLSRQTRYYGHLHPSVDMYSIAQHSVICAKLIQGTAMAHDKLTLTCLLHDASEAYLGDVARPLKKILPKYKVIENTMMRVISEKFGLYNPLPIDVKEIDNEMLRTEWANIVLDFTGEMDIWNCTRSEQEFMTLFNELSINLNGK